MGRQCRRTSVGAGVNPSRCDTPPTLAVRVQRRGTDREAGEVFAPMRAQDSGRRESEEGIFLILHVRRFSRPTFSLA